MFKDWLWLIGIVAIIGAGIVSFVKDRGDAPPATPQQKPLIINRVCINGVTYLSLNSGEFFIQLGSDSKIVPCPLPK